MYAYMYLVATTNKEKLFQLSKESWHWQSTILN